MDLIPYSRQSINEEDISLVTKTLSSNFLTQGPRVPEFERSLESKMGVNYAIVCSSGTAALHLAYASAGINEKSLGIVPAITFAATANALRYQGAEVLFCDVEPESGLISVSSLEECISNITDEQKENLNLIAPVSFAGSVAPLISCKEIADKNNFVLMEDASHSPGAWKYDQSDEKMYSANGKHALASTLSFHPVKHICAGEGGAVLTNDEELAQKASQLRSHGIKRPFNEDDDMPWYYEQEALGWNYRLTDLQAALGLSQLARIEQFLMKRRALAKRYNQILSQSPFKEHINCPPFEDGHAWHLYIIRFLDHNLRNQAYKFFKNNNILTQIHYIPVYKHPYYKKHRKNYSLPGAEAFYQGCLSIPMFPDLNEAEQDRVLETLETFLTKG
ncbi:MAG: UDP-4-amino-4,6-dideoxy-N-acetyl-beta-L-altrosamine transaminase [Opitutae bacterium]|jgi:perosamine synthetase|nr:UDP-4-amino-4,6-dideoxy-N-acetyl-beta-L-altrosamine transaminase [Opitutae bacterium]MBT5715762.1 UDP-4-amino-4,6-dideoxy-N-acetyl-beta-L-altrosamine transaminase [Opitutae bacterium]